LRRPAARIACEEAALAALPGVSLVKITVQAGLDPNAAVTTISNLAMADLRRLPPGTLPPVVLPFDASSLPVCLITLKANGLTEAQIRDLGQYQVRQEVTSVPVSSVPQPFGGKYRQIMVYVNPLKLDAYHLSSMDIVHAVNTSNLIVPSGDVKVGSVDYNLFTNSQIDAVSRISDIPLKSIGGQLVTVGDVGQVKDSSAIQTNVVRVDGQRSRRRRQVERCPSRPAAGGRLAAVGARLGGRAQATGAAGARVGGDGGGDG